MRVTNRMLANNFLTDMRNNLSNLKTVQSQLSSGKEIRKPSDDPFKVARSMELYSGIQANKQYNENIKDTSNWLDATDTSLDQITNNMQRVRELLVSAGNAAYGSDERLAIKDELNQRIEEVGQILNTNFDGKYLFGGTKVTSTPVAVKADLNGNNRIAFAGKDGSELVPGTGDPNTDNQLKMLSTKLNTEVSQGVSMDYNVTSSELLSFTNEKGKSINVSDLLNQIVNNLDDPSQDAKNKITGDNLQGITDTITNLLKVRAEVGAKQNRMESAQEKNQSENYNLTDILSSNEDIDYTEKMMDYSVLRSVYMASLQTSSKVIQPTLLDYV
ncbi:flagellar hook-associated protein FlgL [Inconstantimicrobium mannanitabidum]|uniref:Flagellar hook-associated protein 3 n=1 Tax=Inconstantimicrobium mannanitabidum TaxID=1604901 RepID=A0ACB5R8E0_9CLOT|nr:flagellar hook-associated protein FlgL [Clostridium sp. TW13]GKX65460.1 flagellar hook-associated protein 3 [Clostridium sp. TW13]